MPDKTAEPQRPRIAFVTSGLLHGGAETMLYQLLRAIDRRRFDVHVYSLGGAGTFDEKLAALGVPTFLAARRGGLAGAWAVLALLRQLRSRPYDVVQGWMYHGNIGATLAFLFKRQPPTIAWNVRGSLDDQTTLKRLTRIIIRISARLSSIPRCIVFNSKRALQQHVQAGYRAERTRVIPNGFDCRAFAPNAASRAQMRERLGLEAAVAIGLVARLDPIKDHPTFFKAAAILQKRVPDAVFVLIGARLEASNPEVMKMMSDAGIERGVLLLGSRMDVPALVGALDISTSCSIGEGFPNAVGEAMACATPCVVTDVGDCAELVGDTGEIVPPSRPDLLAEAWLRMVTLGEEGRRSLGHRARKRIVERYSLEHVAEIYESLYDELNVAEVS